jgi:hypothetical protein
MIHEDTNVAIQRAMIDGSAGVMNLGYLGVAGLAPKPVQQKGDPRELSDPVPWCCDRLGRRGHARKLLVQRLEEHADDSDSPDDVNVDGNERNRVDATDHDCNDHNLISAPSGQLHGDVDSVDTRRVHLTAADEHRHWIID